VFHPGSYNKTWFFLIIKLAETNPDNVIVHCEICNNHSDRIAHTTVNPMFEKEVIQWLIKEIFTQASRNITIITFKKDSIPILRQRIIFHDIFNVSFQDIIFLSLERILLNYFSINFDENKTIEDVSEQLNVKYLDGKAECMNLQHIFCKILPLLPNEVAQ